MQAVVLAGGLATRLGGRTRQRPKYLLPVAGRPFGAWQLDMLRSCGFAEVVLCIGHLGEQIRAHFGRGESFGLTIRYVHDGPRLLGTAGALRRALELLAPAFVVTYGDSYLPFDYAAPLRDLEAHPNAAATLAVFRNRNQWDHSNLRVRGERVLEYRKIPAAEPADPTLEDIDYGAMALRRQAVASWPAGVPLGLETKQAELAAAGRMRAYRACERFFEIGSEQGLATLDRELLEHPELYPNTGAGGAASNKGSS